jgi:hypothetical protein
MQDRPSRAFVGCAIALLFGVLMACGGGVLTEWEPHVSKRFSPVCASVKTFYIGDTPALMAAGGIIIGDVWAGGGSFTDNDELSDGARYEALVHGGTHMILTDETIERLVVPITGAHTRCQTWGTTVDCSTTPPTSVTLKKPHARYVVVRVEKSRWSELPPELRPRC